MSSKKSRSCCWLKREMWESKESKKVKEERKTEHGSPFLSQVETFFCCQEIMMPDPRVEIKPLTLTFLFHLSNKNTQTRTNRRLLFLLANRQFQDSSHSFTQGKQPSHINKPQKKTSRPNVILRKETNNGRIFLRRRKRRHRCSQQALD